MSISPLRIPPIEALQCEVCGSHEVEMDEVQSGGRLLLAECGRCDHRFTARVGSSRVVRARGLEAVQPGGACGGMRPVEEEVATAA